MQETPITLYYFPTPNGFKASIMLEEVGAPYEVEIVSIVKGDQFKEDFLAISPNNKIPVIVDPEGPDGKPISVFETGAILQYLGRKFGKLYPTEERARTLVDQWLFWQVAGHGPMAGQVHHFWRYAPEDVPYAKERYLNETKRLYGVLDKQLANNEFVAGDYSIADIAIFGWTVSHDWHMISFDAYKNVGEWHERIAAREPVKRGLAVAAERIEETRKIAEDEEAKRNLFGAGSDKEG
ncbi:MAG: glutathione S-transferase N-terminal domain-containing protein [Pseudomonadota bacterium]